MEFHTIRPRSNSQPKNPPIVHEPVSTKNPTRMGKRPLSGTPEIGNGLGAKGTAGLCVHTPDPYAFAMIKSHRALCIALGGGSSSNSARCDLNVTKS